MLSKTPSVSLLCIRDKVESLPAFSADKPNCFVNVDWVTKVSPPKSAIKPVNLVSSLKDWLRSLLVIKSLSLFTAAMAKLVCNLFASSADTPVFLAILAMLSLAVNAPFAKANILASDNIDNFCCVLNSPLNNLAATPDLSRSEMYSLIFLPIAPVIP